MKKIIFLLLVFKNFLFSQNVTLDINYGVDGKVIDPYSTFESNSFASIQFQTNNKIIGLGYLPFSWEGNHFLVRYNTDGTIDTTFGNNGKVFLPIISETIGYNQLKIQEDDKILISGMLIIDNVTNTGFASMRYSSDGLLDLTYGNNGIVITDINNYTDSSTVIETQNDGKILIAGYSLISPSFNILAISRYNSDGSLDTNFGVNGISSFDLGTTVYNNYSSSFAYDIEIQNDNKILIGGVIEEPNSIGHFCVIRLNYNGQIDSLFANNGIKVVDFPIYQDATLISLKINSNNELILSGYGNYLFTNDYKMAVVKLDNSGNLDNLFAENGIFLTNFNNSVSDFSFDSELLFDDSILLVGATKNTNFDYDLMIIKLNQNGILDTNFNGTGYLTENFGYSGSFGRSILWEENGNLFISGSITNSSSFKNCLVAKYMVEDLSTNQLVKSNFSIHPNPFKDNVNINFKSSHSQVISFDLYDINGRKIKNLEKNSYFNEGSNAVNFELKDIQNGVYFIKIQSENETFTSKIIKL